MTKETMRIAIGADHGGYALKQKLVAFLEGKGYEVADLGTHSAKSCDYPLFARKVAEAVSQGAFERGILVCTTGIGVSMAANKIPGVRAALCYNESAARSSREHNNANVIALGARFVGEKKAKNILKVWLNTGFSGGRHARRVNQIRRIEAKARR